MRPQLRAALWLSATLLVGVLLGMVLNGALLQRRDRAAHPDGGPQGFVAQMERVIQPHDDAQRNQLRPYLLHTDSLNRSTVDGARQSMNASMDSLRKSIAPLLNDEQRQRMVDAGGPNGGRGGGDEGRGSPPGLEFGGRGRGGPPNGEPPRGAPPRDAPRRGSPTPR